MTRQNCLQSHNLLLQLICFAGFLVQYNESLNTFWGCRRLESILLRKNFSHTAFLRPKRKLVIAAGAGSTDDDTSSSSGADPHPPKDLPSDIFFASPQELPSHNNDDDDIELTSIKAKEEEKARVEEEKIRPEEEARLVEEKRIAEEEAGKEWQVKQAEWQVKQARIAEEQRNAEILEWANKAKESVENAIKPLAEVQKGVSAERIKGAALAGTVLGLLVSKGVLASGAVGLSAAYVAISKSVAGDVLRTVGGITWDVTETATKLADKFSTNGVVDKKILKLKREKSLADESDVVEAVEKAYIDSEDDLARVLKEAEEVIGEADAAIAIAEAEVLKEKQSSTTAVEEEEEGGGNVAEDAEELTRIEEEERIAEEARVVAEVEEMTRIEEEERTAEEARVAAEVEETTRIEEMARVVAEAEEVARIEEEERIAEEARVVAEVEEMAAIAEDVRQKADAEEKGRIEELEDDVMFDDDEFMAAVEMAQEGIEGKIVGVNDIITPDNSAKAEWDAAGELASELRQDLDIDSDTDTDLDDEDGDEDIYELGDIDLESLAQAAREAVESYENSAKEVEDAALEQKQQWTDSMVDEDDDDDDFEESDDLFSATNLDDLARAAREAVEAFDDNNKISENKSDLEENFVVAPVMKDWSSFKVAELKEELKKRGFTAKGKKADLVSLLEEHDLELSGEIKGDDAELFEAINGYEDSTALGEGDNAELFQNINEIEYGEEDDADPELENFDIEELGRQARAAVEMFESRGSDFDEEPTEEMLAQLENEMTINGEFLKEANEEVVDIAKMTVAELKEECRKRKLKVGGKKSDLIERLSAATD